MLRIHLTVVEGASDRERVFSWEVPAPRLIHFGRADPDDLGQTPSDPSLSNQHLVLAVQPRIDGAVRVIVEKDLGRNLSVNGAEVESARLSSGDRIGAGSLVFEFRCEGELPAQPPRSHVIASPAQLSLIGEIAGGAMGTVHEAIDRVTGRRVALKRLDLDVSLDPRARAYFRREMEIVQDLDHPNVTRVLGAGEDAESLWIAMEWVEGHSLDEQVAALDPLSVAEIVQIGRELLLALEYVHGRGIVHRDVKPSNVMLEVRDGSRRVRLTDFGLSRTFFHTTLTETGEGRGTLRFMAPELVDGARRARAPADVFGAGATLYHLLTSGAWHYGDDPLAGIDPYVHLHAPYVPIRTRRPDLPPALAAVIDRALARDLGERWRTAGEMGERL